MIMDPFTVSLFSWKILRSVVLPQVAKVYDMLLDVAVIRSSSVFAYPVDLIIQHTLCDCY
jgi:hypothetical protein